MRLWWQPVRSMPAHAAGDCLKRASASNDHPVTTDGRSAVERYLGALARQDWATLATCLTDDVERTGPYNDVYHGRDAYVSFLAATMRTLAGYELHVSRLISGDDVVVAELSETVDMPEGRRRTDEAVVFDLALDGRIRRVGVFLRRQAAPARQNP